MKWYQAKTIIYKLLRDFSRAVETELYLNEYHVYFDYLKCGIFYEDFLHFFPRPSCSKKMQVQWKGVRYQLVKLNVNNFPSVLKIERCHNLSSIQDAFRSYSVDWNWDIKKGKKNTIFILRCVSKINRLYFNIHIRVIQLKIWLKIEASFFYIAQTRQAV